MKYCKPFLLIILLIPCLGITLKYDVDLQTIYHTAKWAAGDLNQVYASHEAMGIGRFFYGPITLVFIYPFGHLSIGVVKLIWTLLQLLSFVGFWFCLHRLFPVLDRNLLGWLIVWVVSINPIHNNFQSNNIQLMLAAMLLLAELLSRREKRVPQYISGILCALAATIKVFPAFIMVLYFLTKSRRVITGMLIGVMLSIMLPLLVFGLDGGGSLFGQFLSNLTTYQKDNDLIRVADILCLPSLLSRLLSTVASSMVISMVVKGGVFLLSALFFGFVWLRRKSDAGEMLHLWSLAFALMVLLNPSTRPHYFIFYVPAFCSLLQLLDEGQIQRWNWCGILFCVGLIAFTVEWIAGGKLFNDSLEKMNLPTWGFILLCVMLLLGVRKITGPTGRVYKSNTAS